MKTNTTYIGVDVAKSTLQIHVRGRQIELDNSVSGHARLCAELQQVESPHVICEATGGYERAMVEALHKKRHRVSVVNPGLVRNAARALGQRAKTDRIDAEMLTGFGERYDPKPTEALTEHQKRIESLAGWLKQLVRAKAILKTQVEHHADSFVCGQSDILADCYDDKIAELEREIRRLTKTDEAFEARMKCLMAIDGVGERTAFLVLSAMPEIGSLNRRQAASLAGLAPWTRESGTMKGRRMIGGGRGAVREAIYMAAFTASRCNPILRDFYQRLIAQGKHHRLAMVAVMRRLLIYMNHQLKALSADQPARE